eukprot:TRINITY_DN68297_c0_g1_i1.p1 TRINITY_DN68297_c0_g1~~TRINITY_DN68297_c0_g1_i1.p1  ORF type:complete len:445 (+),score=27.91 TRINITY_DN68297_c0_g1_i1:53-1336(+)
MFAQQGLSASRGSIPLCTICRAPIRLSWFVLLFFAYELVYTIQSSDGGTFEDLVIAVLQASAAEIILLATVLVHEFGHGTMARRLGGEIDHVLLWVFGGICFTTRPDLYDNRKILRNEFLVVAAGPVTHFPQVGFWGLVLWLLWVTVFRDSVGVIYETPWHAFCAFLNPRSLVKGAMMPFIVGKWKVFLFTMVAQAIQLNVALFLFNVIFPMYPLDGSKLLVTSLMFCCGVTPRTAALVLLCVSVPAAIVFIAYSIHNFLQVISTAVTGSTPNLLVGLMGFVGVMSLFESYTIYDLRRRRLLHTHGLFQVARSWQRVQRDGYGGRVHRINVSEFDDEEPLTTCGCRALCCCFPCWDGDSSIGVAEPRRKRCCSIFRRRGSRSDLAAIEEPSTAAPSPLAPASGDVRSQRSHFLATVQERQEAQTRRI